MEDKINERSYKEKVNKRIFNIAIQEGLEISAALAVAPGAGEFDTKDRLFQRRYFIFLFITFGLFKTEIKMNIIFGIYRSFPFI